MNRSRHNPDRPPPSALPPGTDDPPAARVVGEPALDEPAVGKPAVEDPAVARAVKKLLAGDRASAAAGIRLLEAGPGRARLEMTVRADMANGHGTCHGGYVFLLADTAFAVACNGHGPPAVAASCDIVYLRPVRVGDRLVAEAHERATAGRTGITDVTVRRMGVPGGPRPSRPGGDRPGEFSAERSREPVGEVVAEFRGRSRVVTGSPAREPGGERESGEGRSERVTDAELPAPTCRSS